MSGTAPTTCAEALSYAGAAPARIGSLDLWRVRMKPGKPVAVGSIAGTAGEVRFFGLPGNPVSAMVTFELFVRPALWKMAGRSELARPTVPVRVSEDIHHTP